MDEQAIVDVTITTDYEDFKADLKYLRGKPWAKLICSVGAFVVAFFAAKLVANAWYDDPLCFWVAFYIFSLLPACFAILSVRELLASRPAKLFETYRKTFYIDTPRRYVFTEGCMICIYDEGQHYHGRIEVEYAHYIGAKESGNSFFLQKNAGSIIFPKRCFTEEQIAALHDFLARKFGEKFEVLG